MKYHTDLRCAEFPQIQYKNPRIRRLLRTVCNASGTAGVDMRVSVDFFMLGHLLLSEKITHLHVRALRPISISCLLVSEGIEIRQGTASSAVWLEPLVSSLVSQVGSCYVRLVGICPGFGILGSLCSLLLYAQCQTVQKTMQKTVKSPQLQFLDVVAQSFSMTCVVSSCPGVQLEVPRLQFIEKVFRSRGRFFSAAEMRHFFRTPSSWT